MKKLYLLGIGAAATLMLSACSVGDTTEGSYEVSNFENLPECSSEPDFAGVVYMGKRLYVEEEELYYRCTESGWTESDSLDTVFVSDTVQFALENAVVKGSVNLAGSFEFGSKVTLSEVKFAKAKNSQKFIVTKNVFEDEVSSKWGDFVVSGVNMENNYALASVEGRYQDVFTGELSKKPITMNALVDLTSGYDVKVNLWTTLAFPRAKKLIESGYLAEAALSQAETELKNVFGISDSEDADAAMLALVVLFHQRGDEKDLISALDEFAEDFAEDGTWDDEKEIAAMADFAFNIENFKFVNDDNEVELKNADIRLNLEKFGFVDAAPFESYVTKFWTNSFGLGGCAVARQNAVLQNAAEKSDSADTYFTCDAGAWRVATEFESDTVNLGNAKDGALHEGNVNNKKMYVYDTTGVGEDNPLRWREIDKENPADSMILVFEKACTDNKKETKGKINVSADKDDNDHYWACDNRQWMETNEATYRIGQLCKKNLKDTVVKLSAKKKGEDDTYYKCVFSDSYGSWMETDKVSYLTQDFDCDYEEIQKASNDKYYVCIDKENHTFREAKEMEEKLDAVCSVQTLGNSASKDKAEYICGCKDFGSDPLNPPISTDESICEYTHEWIKK